MGHKDQGGVRGSRDQPRRGAQTSQCRWESPKVLWHLGPQHMAAVQPASQRNFERPCDPAKGRRFYLASLQEECSVLVSETPLRDGLFALSCIDGRAWPKLHLLAKAALIEFKSLFWGRHTWGVRFLLLSGFGA